MKQKNLSQARPVEQLPGIIRKTLAYNADLMLCQYSAKKGSVFPLHSHQAAQVGYVISGRLHFMSTSTADGFEAGPGQSYVFDPNEQHGAEVLEDSIIIEIFSPCRDDFKDG